MKNSRQLTLWPEDSRVSRSATQDEEAQRGMTATSGLKCYESSELSVRGSCWQRTFTGSLLLSRGW